MWYGVQWKTRVGTVRRRRTARRGIGMWRLINNRDTCVPIPADKRGLPRLSRRGSLQCVKFAEIQQCGTTAYLKLQEMKRGEHHKTMLSPFSVPSEDRRELLPQFVDNGLQLFLSARSVDPGTCLCRTRDSVQIPAEMLAGF